jgi:hypothetical protein
MPWARFADLARRERVLVEAERWEDLPALQQERQELIDALPEQPPAEAAPVLAAALRQSRATQQALQVALARTEAAIGEVRRGRRAVSAYGMGLSTGLERRA